MKKDRDRYHYDFSLKAWCKFAWVLDTKELMIKPSSELGMNIATIAEKTTDAINKMMGKL